MVDWTCTSVVEYLFKHVKSLDYISVPLATKKRTPKTYSVVLGFQSLW